VVLKRQHLRLVRLRATRSLFCHVSVLNRKWLLGEMVADEMHVNTMGSPIPQHFPKVALNDFVAIFNHVHRILLLDTNSKSLSPRMSVVTSQKPSG
jgi:uncharacterized protein YqkB